MEVKKLIQVYLLIFLFPCIHFGQIELVEYNPKKIRKEIHKIVKKIAKDDGIDSEAVGYGGERTSQYNRFIKLTKNANIEELIELTNHPNSSVRGYSFWSLAKRRHNKLEEIFIAHANDEELVFLMDGCSGGELPLIGFMGLVVTPKVLDVDCKKFKRKTFMKMYKANKGMYKNNKE